MSILENLDRDLKEAMVSKDADRLSTIRFLKSALKYAALEKKGAALSEADAVQVIQKQIKQRRESVQQFKQGGRAELAAKEEKEIGLLEGYLPKQMDEEELRRFIETQIRESGAASKKDFGRVMKLCNEKLAGRADNKRLSEALGKILV